MMSPHLVVVVVFNSRDIFVQGVSGTEGPPLQAHSFSVNERGTPGQPSGGETSRVP